MLIAGLLEAEARAIADVKRYDAMRDQTYREISELLAQAQSRKEILGLFRSSILPKSQAALEAAGSVYQNGTSIT
jgi:cobalt-zinc-cadmium efflux system outer membrane protein